MRKGGKVGHDAMEREKKSRLRPSAKVKKKERKRGV